MKEKIISVSEEMFDNMDGYIVTTNKQRIKLGISGFQACCEKWGYFLSQDDVSEFIGANVLDVAVVDTLLNVNQMDDIDIYEGDVMFVNIETSRGTLQFVAYNEHNGYYGHTAIVECEQLNYTTCL